ncbi:MAG: DUF3316 domain-containing protein [Candidatus Azobacteroides sp.]|nr:DUF3316 domain-containing protein [Candidatus Azobacteroides sp.]
MKSPDNNGCFRSRMQFRRQKTSGGNQTIFAFCILSFVSFFPLFCLSQEVPGSLTYKAFMVGYGISSVYDSYLSPLNYTGENVGLYYEQMKNTKLMNGNVSAQHLFNLNYSWSKNDPETASYYTGFLEYDYGLYRRFKPVNKLQVFAGMQGGGLFGVIYNTRNGNNPATGKGHVNLSLSAIADYKLQIRSQPLHFRYQLNVPFIGAMYSPQFGQSYYEIGLGATDNLVHFASFHNYFFASNMLSAEIPLNNFTLRFSYHFSFYETRINDLDTRLITNTFYIGFSYNFFIVSGKQKNNNYRYVFE